MDYFVSCLYGDYQAYKRIEKKLSEYDHLYVLGDVLDGNTEHPEGGVRIVEDIYRNPNVTLLLGDHEYFHAMRLISIDSEDEEAKETWEDSLEACDISGKPLMDYLDSIPYEETAEFERKLLSFEATDLVKIGSTFFYLCHGSPALRTNIRNGNISWQYNVVTGYPDFFCEYTPEMASDLRLEDFAAKYGDIDMKNACVITGHVPVEELSKDGVKTISNGEDAPAFSFQNRKFCLNQNITADDIGMGKRLVLCIDAGGFMLKEF